MPAPLPVEVASSITDLHAKVPVPINGQIAVLRVGAGANAEDYSLAYHSNVNRWIEYEEREAIRGNDQLDMDVQPTLTTKQVLKRNTIYDPFDSTESPVWGFHAVRNAAVLYAAGMTLLYRHAGWCKGSHETPMRKINVGACFFEVNDGDAEPGMVPSSSWGETTYLNGGVPWVTTVANYQWQETGWTQLLAPGGGALAAPAKSSLMCAPFGYMDAGGAQRGGVRSYQVYTKWASR